MSKAIPFAMTATAALQNKTNRSAENKEYYKEANALKSPSDFSQVIYHQEPVGFAPVLKDLMPDRIPYGSTMTDVEHALGKPRFILDNTFQVSSHTVLFYRQELGPYIKATQFHFFQGRLAYVEARYLEHGRKKSMGAKEVLKRLVRRYAGADGLERAYQDVHGNRLWVENGEQLVLHYLSGDPALKSAFSNPAKIRNRRPSRQLHWLRDTA